MSHFSKIIEFDDNGLLGIYFTDSGYQLLAINVYLPYFSEENADSYLVYVGKISSIMEDDLGSEVMVMDDFNACVGGGGEDL